MQTRRLHYPLTAFITGFNRNPSTNNISTLLLQATFASKTPPYLHRWRGKRRSYATSTGKPYSPLDEQTSSLTITANTQEDPKVSIARLDPYLPLELRSKTWLENLAAFEGVRSAGTLPAVLNDITASFRFGILAHIALQQNRWSAYLFLAKALVKQNTPRSVEWVDALQQSPWLYDTKIGGIGDDPIRMAKVETSGTARHSLLSLDLILDHNLTQSDYYLYQKALGQVWQSLGLIVLQAAEADRDRATYMMSHVHQVIAYMHSNDKMPLNIYDYGDSHTPAALRKPPILHFMSSRLMTTLSNAVCEAGENEVLDNHTLTGISQDDPELIGPYPYIRSIGQQVWLELILCSCLHSGFVEEAAKILRHLVSKTGTRRWGIAGWKSLQHSGYEYDSATKSVEETRLRVDRIAGAHEGYKPPLAELPPRTISSEVVTLVVDGLLNKIREGNSFKYLGEYVKRFRDLLQSQEQDSEVLFWNSTMLRFLNTADFKIDARPAFLDSVLTLAPTQERLASVTGILSDSETATFEQEQAPPVEAMLLRTLDSFAQLGNVNSCLRVFAKLQAFIDGWRARAIKDFLLHRSLEDDIATNSVYPGRDEDNPVNDHVEAQREDEIRIPVHTLVTLLELFMKNSLYDLGRWLLSSNDVDGPVIPRAAIALPGLQPALLRFATAISEYSIVLEIMKHLDAGTEPVSENVLRALLHCQVNLCKLGQAQESIRHLRNQYRLRLNPVDIMIIARKLLQLDYGGESGNHDLAEAQAMMKHILSRGFLPPSNPAKPPDYTPFRELNQISSILATAPGSLAVIAQEYIVQSGPGRSPIDFPAEAFDIFLEAVAQTQGSAVARTIFNHWCKVPQIPQAVNSVPCSAAETGSSLPVMIREAGDMDKVVRPSLQTIRIVLAPALKQFQESLEPPLEDPDTVLHPRDSKLLSWEDAGYEAPEPEMLEQPWKDELSHLAKKAPTKELLAWGVAMYQRMGLTRNEIMHEMPLVLSDPKERAENLHDDSD